MPARGAVLGGGPAFADGSGRIPDVGHLCAGLAAGPVMVGFGSAIGAPGGSSPLATNQCRRRHHAAAGHGRPGPSPAGGEPCPAGTLRRRASTWKPSLVTIARKAATCPSYAARPALVRDRLVRTRDAHVDLCTST